MAEYVVVNNRQYVEIEDGVLVPVNVSLSLEGGTLVKLPTSQLESLTNPALPNSFPLPVGQVLDLKQVAVLNLPDTYNIGNFPAGFACSNLPSAYPLPSSQEALLNGIATSVTQFTKGAGNVDGNTLRAVLVTNQPRLSTTLPNATMTSIATTGAGDKTLLTPSVGKALRISSITVTAANVVTVQFKQGTVAEGQSNLSGAMEISDLVSEFPRTIALVADRSLVVNVGSAIALNGYVTWWEE